MKKSKKIKEDNPDNNVNNESKNTKKPKKSHKKGLRVFLIILLIIVLILRAGTGFVWYKMNHLISPEVVAEVMKIYRGYETDGEVKEQVVDSVVDLGVMTSINQANYSRGPISVTPAILTVDGIAEEITLVTLGGTQNLEGQATTMEESKLASMGKTNDYLKAVLKVFDDGTVPKDKPVMISGISLGGMIAQQILGEKSVTDNYIIKAVITFGSPITMPFDRGGVKVVRFVDSNDIVPKLGEKGMSNKNDSRIPALQKEERIMLTGAHKDGIETHALSYISDSVWDAYDFMGVKGGNATLELLKPLTFYKAPKLS